VLQRDRACRGGQAGDVEIVLDQHGDPVQRPARAGLGALEVQQRRVGQGIRVDEPDGVEPGAAVVERGDALQIGLGQLDARELARRHPGLELGDGEALEVERGGRGGRRREQEAGDGQDQTEAHYADTNRCATWRSLHAERMSG
jgi:hypothetical protein